MCIKYYFNVINMQILERPISAPVDLCLAKFVKYFPQPYLSKSWGIILCYLHVKHIYSKMKPDNSPVDSGMAF